MDFDGAAPHLAVEPGYTLALVLIFGSLVVAPAAVALLLRAAAAVVEAAAAGRVANAYKELENAGLIRTGHAAGTR